MTTPPVDLLGERIRRVRQRTSDAALDAFLVTHLPNLQYLTGFRATAGAALVFSDRLVLLTDSRYRAQAQGVIGILSGLTDARLHEVISGTLDAAIVEAVRAYRARRVGIEGPHLAVSRFEFLTAALGRATEPGRDRPGLVVTERIVEQGRLVKDSFEIGVLREAGRRLSGVARHVPSLVRPGRTETELAAEIDYAVRRAGFERSAFETIVASGPNGVRPHARPTDRVLRDGDPVVLDFGGVYDGYCVDLTRTVAVGAPKAELVALHEAVLEAQAEALAVVRPGVPAGQIDAAARGALARWGLAEAFGHGTGHGLGLEIHEEPRIGRPVEGLPEALVEAGMVFTVEPGVYVPEVGGVRLEDDVLVTDHGCECLTDVPRDLTGRRA